MSDLSVKELVEMLPDAYRPGSDGIPVTIQIVANGEGGGEWTVILDKDKCKVETGKMANADLKFIGKTSDILDVVSGKLDGMKAFMLGKIRFSGSMNLAIKISQLFVIPPELAEKL